MQCKPTNNIAQRNIQKLKKFALLPFTASVIERLNPNATTENRYLTLTESW